MVMAIHFGRVWRLDQLVEQVELSTGIEVENAAQQGVGLLAQLFGAAVMLAVLVF